jgi:transcription initiation factor TFIID subunit 2
LQGYTEITIVPTHKDLKTIHLHSRQCSESISGPSSRPTQHDSHALLTAIHSVTVGPHKADFVQLDPFAALTLSNPQDCHAHPELKRKVYSAYAEGDEGELSIAIPKEITLRLSGGAASERVSQAWV